jgi:hypothetical protein
MASGAVDQNDESAPPRLPTLPETAFSATPLTNGSMALSWSFLENIPEYQVYSDMGSGFGLYLHKTKTSQPAFIDKQLRFGTTYDYRLVSMERQQPVILGQIQASTFARKPGATDPVPSEFDVTTVSVTAAPTALPPDAVLLGLVSDNNYTDVFNTLSIVGEVRNDSNLDVGQTDITVTFYDSAGTIIGTANGETMLDVIPPGEKSPFIITLTRPAGLASHSLRAVARPVSPESDAQLTVSTVKRFEDEAGFFHIKGTIENVGSTTARRVKVGAVVYNRDDRVINVGFTYANPPKLAPGETASYDIIFDYYPRYFAQQVIPFEE